MAKIHKTITVDQLLWNQFQAFFPRQASSMIEQMMQDAVGIHIEMPHDTQVAIMKEKVDEINESIKALSEEKRIIDAELGAWEAEQRKLALIKEKERKEAFKRMVQRDDASKAAGRLRRAFDD